MVIFALGPLLKAVAEYSDGLRTTDDIFEAFLNDFMEGRLHFRRTDKNVVDEADLRPILKERLLGRLQFRTDNALLVE